MHFWQKFNLSSYYLNGTNYFNNLKMRNIFHDICTFVYNKLYIVVVQYMKVINIVFYLPKRKKIILDLLT